MTRDELVALIKVRLGFRTDTDIETNIVTELKFAQIELERREELPWFLLSEMATAACVADEERVQVPGDFLREYEYGFLWLYDASDSDDPWKELAKDDYGALKAGKTGTGQPTHYALRGKYLTLHPTPDAVYTLKFVYFGADETLDAGSTENEWTTEAPDVLMNKAGIPLATGARDQVALPLFTAQYTAALKRMDDETIARHEAAAMRNMGDD